MEKLRALWTDVVDSLWFWPALITSACAAAALLLVRYNDAMTDALGLDPSEQWWLFGGSPSGAMSVLEAIAGSIMTVTGVVFSVTIIALQLSANQYTPRVLRQFMANRTNQVTLGVFIGNFTYALLVLRTIRTETAGDEFVPALAVTGGVLLTLLAMGFLIFFINHVARSLQAPIIIDTIAQESLRIVSEMYPEKMREWSVTDRREAEDVVPAAGHEAFQIRSGTSGYVQAVERAGLLRLATRHDLLIRTEVQIGSHVLPGEVIMNVWSPRSLTLELESQLWNALVLGEERTPHQDLRHTIIEMQEVAVKALSPAINDPTTAINVIHRLAQVLLDLAWREGGVAVDKDESGTARVVIRRPDFAHIAGLAFDQIRHYGSDNATVASALLDNLADLAALSPEPARTVFARQLDSAITSARDRMKNPADKARLEQAIAQALERRQEQPPRQRPHA